MLNLEEEADTSVEIKDMHDFQSNRNFVEAIDYGAFELKNRDICLDDIPFLRELFLAFFGGEIELLKSFLSCDSIVNIFALKTEQL